MNCEKFQEELLKYYLGEEDEKPKASEYIKMQSHLRSCQGCSKASEQLKGIQAALNAIISQKTSSTFMDGLTDKMPKPSPVTQYLNTANKKLSSVPRPVWFGLVGLIIIIGLVSVWGYIFPSTSLPVIYYNGDVDIRLNADTAGWKKLDGYIDLNNGDKIKTDNSACVVFVVSKDTSVRLGENTTARIVYMGKLKNKGYDCRIELIEGLLWVSQQGMGDKETELLKIITQNAVVKSSRAIFDVSFSDNNRTLLRVFGDGVDFSHQHFAEENTNVSKGFSSITSSDQPPTSPSKIDMVNLGGWETWNLKTFPSGIDLLSVNPEELKEGLKPPPSLTQLHATPPPTVEVEPTPTPGWEDFN